MVENWWRYCGSIGCVKATRNTDWMCGREPRDNRIKIWLLATTSGMRRQKPLYVGKPDSVARAYPVSFKLFLGFWNGNCFSCAYQTRWTNTVRRFLILHSTWIRREQFCSHPVFITTNATKLTLSRIRI